MVEQNAFPTKVGKTGVLWIKNSSTFRELEFIFEVSKSFISRDLKAVLLAAWETPFRQSVEFQRIVLMVVYQLSAKKLKSSPLRMPLWYVNQLQDL